MKIFHHQARQKFDLSLLYEIGDCEDKNILCEMLPAILLDILCKIDLVKQQCPKRCDNCPVNPAIGKGS